MSAQELATCRRAVNLRRTSILTFWARIITSWYAKIYDFDDVVESGVD